jgi:hypothetical protein
MLDCWQLENKSQFTVKGHLLDSKLGSVLGSF